MTAPPADPAAHNATDNGAAPDTASATCAIVTFLHETGHLKRTRREGWWIAGLDHPESVAEHSHRTAVIGYVLGTLENANPERAATLGLFHDLPETRLSDIPSTGKQYLTTTAAEHVITDQTASLPPTLHQPIRSLIAEFEQRTTLDAICAKDADRLECLLQAREYQAAGNTQLQPWIDTMHTAMVTTTARALAAAATNTPPNRWWHHIVASYGQASLLP